MFSIPDTLARPDGLTDDRILRLGGKELAICLMALPFVRYVYDSISAPHNGLPVSTAIGYHEATKMVWAVTRGFDDQRLTHAFCVSDVEVEQNDGVQRFLMTALATNYDSDRPLVIEKSVDGVDTVIAEERRPN